MKRDLSHADVLALIKDRPESFAPGASWRYSNTGPYLAGMAIEHVTGMSYAGYLRERVFAPLGMTSASLCTAHDAVPALAHGYDVRDGRLVAAAPATWTTPPGTPQGRAMTRVSPFVYLADADTEVRFQRPPGPVEWAMVYSGGLFADAASRIH